MQAGHPHTTAVTDSGKVILTAFPLLIREIAFCIWGFPSNGYKPGECLTPFNAD
jgi:hypothetical protein